MADSNGWFHGLRQLKWRKWLRALHRDIGYLAVGLTFVYALSGIAINHVADWDPNFAAIEETHQLPAGLNGPVPGDAQAAQRAARAALDALKRNDRIDDVYALDEAHLDITLEHSTLYVDFKQQSVREEGQRPRVGLRVANWLHLNRGKKAWTYIADGYALVLLYLATSGLFMLPGSKGLRGRGAVLSLLGAAIPVLYVVLSDGP
jgi:hypothetical protein